MTPSVIQLVGRSVWHGRACFHNVLLHNNHSWGIISIYFLGGSLWAGRDSRARHSSLAKIIMSSVRCVLFTYYSCCDGSARVGGGSNSYRATIFTLYFYIVYSFIQVLFMAYLVLLKVGFFSLSSSSLATDSLTSSYQGLPWKYFVRWKCSTLGNEGLGKSWVIEMPVYLQTM